MKLRWRFGIAAGIFLALFSLYPQMKMLYLRGGEWNGHYAYNDIDEVAYSAYLRALIDGRPRKNDPYTGRDHTTETPQPESLFSIQFAAPYSIAIPARILGIGTPWAMTLSGALAAFLAGLAVFWFIGMTTRDSVYAMAAALGVFCFGTLAAGEGAILEIFYGHTSYPYFPGFRRYIPAMAIPAFFAMIGFVWKMLESGNKRYVYGGLAVICYAYTVYSYFYIWTTAAAWLVSLGLVILILRPDAWRTKLKVLVFLGVACAASMLPYAYLLSQRSETMEHVQLLVLTRMPDLFRFPEYIAAFVILLLAVGLLLKRSVFRSDRDEQENENSVGSVVIKWSAKDGGAIFAFSLALTVFAVFNQQIITGRSLQPIHYQVFIGNYVAALAVMAAVGYFWFTAKSEGSPKLKYVSAVIALSAVVWGFVECHYTVRVLDWANEHRDASYKVAERLEQLAANDADPHRDTVLIFDRIISDDLPTIAPQNVLWARHQHVFAGLTWQESKERYYQYLYYSNVQPERLDHLLKNDFVSQIALFGWGRHTDRLTVDSKPLTFGEIAEEVGRYAEYIENFGRENAADPRIKYLVVANDSVSNLENIEKWYEPDRGEVIGNFSLFTLTPRDAQE